MNLPNNTMDYHMMDETNSTLTMNKVGTDYGQLGNTFDTKHLIGTMIVFWGTISIIIGGAIYCWYRYFRNHTEEVTGEEDPENDATGNANGRYDGATRRDTLIMNLRRASRRDTLILPFTLH